MKLQIKIDSRQTARNVGRIIVYVAAIWLTIAFVGYGLALNRHHVKNSNQPGTVYHGYVVERSGLGLGLVGDICIEIFNGPRHCIRQSYINPKIASGPEIYRALTPKTEIFMKALGGEPLELLINPKGPNVRALLSYDYAYPHALRYLQSSGGGTLYILFGVLWLPAIVLFRVAWPRIKERLAKAETPLSPPPHPGS